MLSEEGDNLSAVLQITAGAGGTESCDWASMMMRMYLMWAEKQGYKVKELNSGAVLLMFLIIFQKNLQKKIVLLREMQ